MNQDPSDDKTRLENEGAAARSSLTPEIPDHELLRRIGGGSYGEVWLARNIMGTYRAVKIVYRKTFSSDRPYEREFTGIQKFEPISRSHEGLVDVLQVGRNDRAGYFYYVMELADDASAPSVSPVAAPVKARSDSPQLSAAAVNEENETKGKRETKTSSKLANRTSEIANPDAYVPKTLSKELHNRGRLPTEECLELSLSLTKALGHLHQHGLIHRDIKPSNIILVNGIPKFADIGLVADVGEARSFVGTEGFIPPEGPGTARSDLYSLGKVVYEICTGKDRQDFPELPTLMGEGGDRTELLELNEVVLKACEADVTKRYQTAGEMHADLVLMQSGKSLKHFRTVERRLALLTRWGVAAAVAVALGFGAYYIRQRQQKEILARDLQLKQTKLEARERELQLTKRLADSTTHSALRLVEELFSADNSSAALAQLANLVRQDPRNKIATQRLLSALSQRSFALPTIKPLRHDNYVLLAQFSKDGQRVATASLDNTARVWDTATGQPMTVPLRHAAELTDVQFSPDGRLVVTASHDKTARIWNSQTGQPVTESLNHEGRVNAVRFSPDGQRLVTASFDKTAKIWDVETGKLAMKPLDHSHWVMVAEFSPDATRLVTLSGDKTVRIWNLQTGQPLLVPVTLNERSGLIKERYGAVQFSPDGRRILIAPAEKTVRIYSAQTGQAQSGPLEHGETVVFAQFSPDGHRVVTASLDKTARIWDADTSQPLTAPLQHNGGVIFAQFSPDGLRVVTASGDKTARVWDAGTGQPLTEPIKQDDGVLSAQFGPDGQKLVTAAMDMTAQVWNVREGRMRPQRIGDNSFLRYAQFSPDGKRLLLVSTKKPQVWDVQSGKAVAEPLKHQSEVTFGKFSPDGQRIVTAAGDKTALVWNAQTGQPLTSPFKHNGAVASAEFSSDGRRVVTASLDRTARVWDVQTGEPVTDPLKHDGWVFYAQFSPDGKRVVTASTDKTARIWDATTGQALTPPLNHSAIVQIAQFSPDGQRVVTASFDKSARIWDSHTGQPLTEPLKHQGRVGFAQFSPDGQRVAVGSGDGIALIWDAHSGRVASEPLKHKGLVGCLQFSADGLRLVTGSYDNTARIWDILTGHALSEPLAHKGYVYSVQFSPDGQNVVAVSSGDSAAQIWQAPAPPLPAPDWLPELAECVARERLNPRGVSEAVSSEDFIQLKTRLAQSPTNEFYGRWVSWFLADRGTRAISPFGLVTGPEYVQQRIKENTMTGLHEALRLSPTNGLAFARLARRVLDQDPKENPRRLGEADLFSRRAVEFAPNKAEVAEIRQQVTEQVAASGKN